MAGIQGTTQFAKGDKAMNRSTLRDETGLAFIQRIDAEYRAASGLRDRRYYSIFYGIPARSDLLMLNANPGGTPDNFQIVNVAAGEHEYIEGANSGATTRNGAMLLQYLADVGSSEGIRHVQVSNIAFRRSSDKSSAGLPFAEAVREAKPFVEQIIRFVQPKAILFAGDSNLHTFARVHRGELTPYPEESLFGPNGSRKACYYARYGLALPYLGEVEAYTIYHPSKMNGHFRREVFPILREHLGKFAAPPETWENT